MQIKVLRKVKYERVKIYVIQFEYVFQYWFHFNDGLYQNHIELIPNFWKRMLYRLGIINNPFSKGQISDGEEIALSGAMKTYDEITSPEFIKNKQKAVSEEKSMERASAELARKKKAEKGCIWQAREGKEKYYFCLQHNVAVRMKDGEQPKHD